MNFHEIFVFNDFLTMNWNIVKSTWYTFIHWKLSKDTKSMTRPLEEKHVFSTSLCN
jgi:hypothetical protein